MSLEIAVAYVQKIEELRSALQAADRGCIQNGDTVGIDIGRKYDRIYIQTYHNGQPNQKMARYFVDRHAWVIYGCKSYTQVNERRQFGTLDTIEQYDWSAYQAVPKAGTQAEKLHLEREAAIVAAHKRRGRPRKQP
jgi:hypothetical protein